MKKIELTQGKSTFVDDEDFDKISKYKYFAHRVRHLWYAKRKENGSVIGIHRDIMNCPKGMIVDHIDGNGLNNLKSNLRICTQSENAKNSRSRVNSKSKYIGVTSVSKSNKWRATIKNNGKYLHLGCFNTEEEAANIYNKKAKELHGEFARINIFT